MSVSPKHPTPVRVPPELWPDLVWAMPGPLSSTDSSQDGAYGVASTEYIGAPTRWGLQGVIPPRGDTASTLAVVIQASLQMGTGTTSHMSALSTYRTNGAGVHFMVWSNRIYIAERNDTGGGVATSVVRDPTAQQNHVTYVREVTPPVYRALFINGVLVESVSAVTSWTAVGSVYVGQSHAGGPGGTGPFSGHIEMAMHFSRALDAGEVARLYRAWAG